MFWAESFRKHEVDQPLWTASFPCWHRFHRQRGCLLRLLLFGMLEWSQGRLGRAIGQLSAQYQRLLGPPWIESSHWSFYISSRCCKWYHQLFLSQHSTFRRSSFTTTELDPAIPCLQRPASFPLAFKSHPLWTVASLVHLPLWLLSLCFSFILWSCVCSHPWPFSCCHGHFCFLTLRPARRI